MSTRWSAFIKSLGPSWLTKDDTRFLDGERRETNSRVLYVIGLILDARIARVRKGIRARFPGGGAPEDALPQIGRDLKIPRGPDESRENYEIRLQRAIDDWRSAGTAWSMLEQIRGYCSPHAVRLRLVNNHGHMYTIDRDGTRSRNRSTPWNWDGITTAGRGRFWIIIYPTTNGEPWEAGPNIGDPDLWGGAVGSTGYTIGTTATPGDVQAIQSIVRTFKPPGRCVSIIIALEDTMFDPAVAHSLPEDGTWGKAHIYPGYDPARSADARYWIGTSIGTGL